jgi:hypothetical protein
MMIIDAQYVAPTQDNDGLTAAQYAALKAWISARVATRHFAESSDLWDRLREPGGGAWQKKVRLDVFEKACAEYQAEQDALRPQGTL